MDIRLARESKWIEETKKGATYRLYIAKGLSEETALKMIWEVKQDWEASNSMVLNLPA